MSKRIVTILIVVAVLAASFSLTAFAQKADKIKSQANSLLKGYKPPPMYTLQMSETPAEAWQKQYERQKASVTIRYAFSLLNYSTEYNTTNYSAYQVLGAPNVYPSNNAGGSWASASPDGQREFLEVGYLNPAPISAILVYETYAPGAIDTIYVMNPNTSQWDVVWSGVAAPAGPQGSARIFEVDFPTTAYPVSAVRLAINSPAVPSYNEIDAIAIASGPMTPPLRANTMPSNNTSTSYANAVVGVGINVWGNINGGQNPYQYWLDYGDGTIDSGSTVNGHYIGSLHTYGSAGLKTMKLLVHDYFGRADSDQSTIKVYPSATQQINVNMAIEKGLLYDYNSQYPDGSWKDCNDVAATTGAALLAMEENGHLASNDINRDIYAEYVKLGLTYLYSTVGQFGIYPQGAGFRDAMSNGLGAYFTGSTYANGLACLAVLASHSSAASAQQETLRVGAYNGFTAYDLIEDCVDQLCFSQTDPGSGSQQGGWRYCANCDSYGSSDNSATQWPALVLEAAQNSWGIDIPQWVKNELALWLQYSQNADGGFGYTDPTWRNIAKTGSAIGSYAFLDSASSSVPIQSAIHFLDSVWNNTVDNNGYVEMFNWNLYAMYAVTKGMRLIDHRVGVVYVGSHDWYSEFATFLLAGQYGNGSYPSNVWLCGNTSLTASFGTLILTQGVVIAPPVAVIAPISPQPPNRAFAVNGSGSYHQDPSRFIKEWKWDWNAADGINWDSANATGPMPTNPGYPDTGTYTITLRVMDNSVPPRYATRTINVVVDTGNHPPIAIPIPPNRGVSYAGHVGESILLDARASYDPDAGDSIVAYSWDLDGNGVFGDATTDTVSQVFGSEYQGQVGLRVFDTHGDSSTNTAYVNIAASRKDIFVVQFTPIPFAVTPDDTLNILAVFKNSDSSNVDVPSALVRIYDGDPLTTGRRFGDDYYVGLPIGQPETLRAAIRVPSDMTLGTHKLTVWLDANQQIAEWNEINNFDSATVRIADSVSGKKFRSSSMADWATSSDQKSKLKPVKCKPDKVDFKFAVMNNSSKPADALSLSFAMSVDAAITDAVTGDTVQMVSNKSGYVTFYPPLDSGRVIQVQGIGHKGSRMKVQFFWDRNGKKDKKATVPDSLYSRNNLLLPEPDLQNIGQLFPTNVFPIIVGSPADVHSVRLSNYSAALASLNKKGTLHTGPPHCLLKLDNGNPITKPLKSLPPDKMNNSLFAEQLALKLNILASDYGMFPTGFGDLIYDASNVDPTDPFNGDSVRKVVRIVDDYLSCKSTVAGADSTRYLNVLHNLNLAFRDSVLDTLSWSCSSLRFRGIRTVQEVVFMRGGTTNTPALPFAYVPNSLDEPTSFSLKQNYPNPFNPTTNIQFELPNPGTVTLVVYNILGQEITRLLDRQRVDAGVQEVQFNAQQLPSGVYFYRIVAEIGGSDETGATDQGIKTFVSVKKMLLLK